MGTPFIGEIRMFAGNFAPSGWAFCDGQIVPIAENEALFSLIGTTYGGDGLSVFALPDLRGRIPLHQGVGVGGAPQVGIGEISGFEEVTLYTNQMPAHVHGLLASSGAAEPTAEPTGNALAAASTPLYGSAGGTVAMAPVAVTLTGGLQPHTNLAPFLCVNFIIALFGIYPSRN